METLEEKIKNTATATIALAIAHKAEIACLIIGLLAGELRSYRRIGKAVKRTVMSINE